MSSETPAPDDVPDGMVHVGWRCTNPDHLCVRSLVDAEPEGERTELSRWEHGAGWAPMFVRATDLEG